VEQEAADEFVGIEGHGLFSVPVDKGTSRLWAENFLPWDVPPEKANRAQSITELP
jgi:hypothetical protein